MSDNLDRAKELLKTAWHGAMATINDDGSPHNTPFVLLHDEKLNFIYWGSHPQSQHSKNILRSGQIFVVVYDAVAKGGLYIRAEQAHILEGKELDEALKVHNQFRIKMGKEPVGLSYYVGDSPQRMWSAKTIEFWVNDSERDSDGYVIKDFRKKVDREDLR